MSTKGVTCDLKSKEVIKTLSGVQTIVDSFYPDRMTGNDAANFISSKGKDFVRGNGGNDAYKISKNCKDTVINNYDIHLDDDIIFIDQKYSDLRLKTEPTEQSLEIHATDLGKVATLLKWFKDKTFQHASLRTADGVTAILPELASEIESDNKPIAAEFSLENENCNYARKKYDLSEKQFQKVSRFTAKSKLCRYYVQGNKLNNYLDPGPGNPYGYQYLEGGDGADTYVIGADYGEFNEINNFAEDLNVDFVMFGVVYKDIEADIDQDADDMIVKSKPTYKKSAVGVRIKNFLLDAKYQHIVFQSVDKITFKLVTHYPHKKPMIVDYSHLKFNQILNANSLFPSAGVIYGSSKNQNKISGSSLSTKLTGGSEIDIIEGGSGGEQIEGFGGNDILKGNLGDDIIFGGDGDDDISGGEGNDVISGGYGADKIDGGPGMDAIVLAGDGTKKEGSKVSLKEGKGEGGDAQGDTYESVEIVHGSNFNDTIEGNNENNILSGNGGQDTLVTYGGYDVLTGGLESDIYDLTNAEGWKVINNFASDSLRDKVLLGDLATHPCIYSYSNDLFVHVRKKNQKFLNLIIKEWYTEETFRHLQLNYRNINGILKKRSYARRTRRRTSVDKWVSFFNTNAKLEVKAHDFESITVQVDDIIKYIPINSYELYLNYVSENKQYRKIKLSNKLSQGPPSFKLKGNIISGVMVSIMISLHRCNQVIAVTSPVNQRSLPTAPTNIRLVKRSSTSLSVSWDIPSKATNPNRHHYQYQCIAMKKGAAPKKVFESLSAKGADTFLFNKLQRDTQYTLKVYSVIGGERSENPLEISTETLNICKNLKEPENGNIIEETIENGLKYAVITCMDGYELAAVNREDSRAKKVTYFNINPIHTVGKGLLRSTDVSV